MASGTERLTKLASCAGCAGKAGMRELSQVLEHLSDLSADQPDLLVGLTAPDDAAVYRLNDEQAVVLTVDFFAPLVDDAYDYGAISATNAMSDVYAMGGEVVLALNIAAFPEDMASETIARIIQGGAEKVREAGGVIAGGHTILDDEPKYGLCVLGLVHPDAIFRKGGAQAGDVLFLTKALGTGIITTAAGRDEASAEQLATAVESMTTLNRHAAHIAREIGTRAMTDVTGYSLMGHAREIAVAGDICLRIIAAAVPTLPGALEHAKGGISTAGARRNREFYGEHVRMDPKVSEAMADVLFDPQTSGGLLMAVAQDRASDAQDRFRAAGLGVWAIGEVIAGAGVEVAA
ncbi:MAG: selenide, water dikinase SelD [Chloroflexi bacterium]|nr:selenide, water dikinase SelD [Chloroflexota bacterium]MCI0782711.1 selenide, water dikinase SelD [Chloroflexota bacterium]MCI0814471.1 selenide, water dikinase SelD [Chloroflexota bacterium]MCI0816683.1 selenide, water dikinase SelD [Chloroflexota bacterium]MCI0819659.1 selenide, water dikinase SelD [Chloroflexota bacterium]